MRDHDIFAASERVSSKANLWADWLSRGDKHLVVQAAVELHLRIIWLSVDDGVRDTQRLVETFDPETG